MRGTIDWMDAQADGSPPPDDALNSHLPCGEGDERPSGESSPSELWQGLPTHDFSARLGIPNEAQFDDDPLDRNPDLWMYRKRTVGLLRRYLRFSLETGRLPSFIGREFFRAKVSFYTAATFEDRVIFVRDVEKALERLEYWDRQLIGRIVLQEHSHEHAARILHCSRSTVSRRFPFVLDLLSEDFLRVGLLAESSKGGSSR
ncbi:MAG TPA: hypothetical protein VNX26_17065 [Candidatus Acidoferrum sp.]|jgi:hypothetical protein|nr:hypothetical protein [Candidatus Acidoferrum sp.]